MAGNAAIAEMRCMDLRRMQRNRFGFTDTPAAKRGTQGAEPICSSSQELAPHGAACANVT